MKLILLRHGESQWNLENRFTGWKDVSLTSTGVQEATFCGEQLLRINVAINSIYTSLLKRSTETTDILADIIKFPKENIQYDWRLNERHYGALQGLNKSETAEKFGDEQVLQWRRSYDIPPPPLQKSDARWLGNDSNYVSMNRDNIPLSECLKDTVNRFLPYWNNGSM